MFFCCSFMDIYKVLSIQCRYLDRGEYKLVMPLLAHYGEKPEDTWENPLSQLSWVHITALQNLSLLFSNPWRPDQALCPFGLSELPASPVPRRLSLVRHVYWWLKCWTASRRKGVWRWGFLAPWKLTSLSLSHSFSLVKSGKCQIAAVRVQCAGQHVCRAHPESADWAPSLKRRKRRKKKKTFQITQKYEAKYLITESKTALCM